MIKHTFLGLLFILISIVIKSQNITIDAKLVYNKIDKEKEYIPASGVRMYFASYLSDSTFVNNLFSYWFLLDDTLSQLFYLRHSNYNGAISFEWPEEKKHDLVILEKIDLLPKIFTFEEVLTLKSDSIFLANDFYLYPTINIKKKLHFLRKKGNVNFLLENYGFVKTSLQEEISEHYLEWIPEFPGGYHALKRYIDPVLNKINRPCIIILHIDNSGKVEKVELKGITGRRIEKKLVDFFCDMPNWKPGPSKKKRTLLTYVIPVSIN
jgi:hypothetical protein